MGQNLILTPGIYHLDRPIEIWHHDTVVLGIGFPTLVPETGRPAMRIADVKGFKIAGLLFDASAISSPMLLQVGTPWAHRSDPNDPTSLQDVFFRIGGAGIGKATTSLVVNSDNVLTDDIWAWRAEKVGVSAATASSTWIRQSIPHMASKFRTSPELST